VSPPENDGGRALSETRPASAMNPPQGLQSASPILPDAPAVCDPLEVARLLIGQGARIFAARPALDGQGNWDPRAGVGGYLLPKHWERTVPSLNWLDPTVRGFEDKAWRPGWALCMVTGGPYDVVDLDPRNGSDGSREQLDAVLPAVYAEASTPSGGAHLLVATLGVGSRDGFLPGVDLKGGKPDGSSRGFVFLAPTRKISKSSGAVASYEWTTCPPAVAPVEDESGVSLAALVRPTPRTTPPPRSAAAAVEGDADRIPTWTAAAVEGVRRELREAHAWAEGYTDERGRGWQKLSADAALRLGSLARADWCPLTLEQAEWLFLEAAPAAPSYDLGTIWRAQHSRGEVAAYPAARTDLAAEVASWTDEPGVRVDPAATAPAAQADDGDDTSAGAAGSASTLLVRLAEERFTFGQSVEGEPFALPKIGPRVVRMLRGGQDSLRAELSEAFYRRHGKAPSQSALADALSVLDGIAARSTPVPLALRVSEAEGAYWLDLGDSTGRAVRVAPGEGWEVRDSAPVLFRRTPLTGALCEPVRGGSLDELWEHLNVSEADRAVVAAILVAALVPDIPHVVVVIDGEQGAGKSTGTKRLAGMIDPSPVQLRRPPTNLETWTTAAAGSWVVAVDNVSTLQPWFSDGLCRASTGDGDVQRRLYTNGDLYVVQFRRCVILNGIDLAGIRDDLADRAVTVHLERLTGRYRDDAELAAAWQQAHPRILGALLDLAVQVLARRHTVALPDPPRMVDFARILAAVDSVLGTDGMARYRALATDLAADAVMSDPVLAAIADAVRLEWTGTAGHLLDLISRDLILSDRYQPREWPKDARAMSSLLRRRAPSLRRLGWEIEDLGRGGKDKQLRWRLTPPLEAGMTAGIGGHQAPSAGIASADARQGKGPLTCGNASATAAGGHGGRQDARFSLLNSEEEAGEAPGERPYGEGADSTPALPALPAWDPFAKAAT
jgi:hypothetical protein